METLKNKIDFAVIINVRNANPNGDPLNGNRPRVNYDGIGEISDVCIKRKIRNRLLEAGKNIFVQSDDYKVDEYKSLKARLDGELKGIDMKDEKKYRDAVCKKWLDVRAFGQVFAFKASTRRSSRGNEDDEEQNDEKAVSIGIRGPVSIHPAFSVSPVSLTSIQITKSVNNEGEGEKKASDTMGMKHRVDHGVYVFYGSINPQLASITGFTDEDADDIKHAIVNLFQNDASTARPEGSMEVYRVYWWKHNDRNGQYSSAKVHRTLKVTLKPGVTDPKDINDYDINLIPLADLQPEVIEGN
ncbi:MAG: type I-C CRISPR-associated protein Cas7/Csd2 [Clostridiales bacterium]|nr:type I-C CRISPR-associated protein Cas7/Csd2 [Clostridiales bacterium]